MSVQVKAASALEALAEDNPASQKVFLDLDAPKALIKLLKVKYMSILFLIPYLLKLEAIYRACNLSKRLHPQRLYFEGLF